MNKTKKNLIALLGTAFFLITASMVNAMEKDDIKDSTVTVVNMSNWPIELSMKVKGKDFSTRLASKESKPLGKIGELADLKYGTYGDYYGSTFRYNYPINLNKAQAGQDLKVILSTWLQNWTEKYELVKKEKGGPEVTVVEKQVVEDPWSEFSPEAKKAFDAGDKLTANRRVLGLKTGFTLNDVVISYKNLIAKWHPDKNSDKLYATEVSKIITGARDILKAELEQKSD